MAKKNQKNNSKWEEMGFAGLILSALNNAGKKKNKKKKEIIKKEYW
tara:strand:+ start:2388 stop:2525 length:138 start_codon:yes stop_codon:yes gene_type:complete